MASLRQIDANRRNGSRGGPKTPEAKQRSRFNALKHQLCAEAVVLPGEDPEVIRQFREDLLEHWQPANAQEQLEFEELVRSAWRLLRARHIETQLWSGYILRMRAREGAPRPETPLETHRSMARVFAEDDACNPDKYFRYERAIERSYYRAIRQLQRTQSLRRREEPPVPNEIETAPPPPPPKPAPPPPPPKPAPPPPSPMPALETQPASPEPLHQAEPNDRPDAPPEQPSENGIRFVPSRPPSTAQPPHPETGKRRRS